jgi:hypothetical protein
MDYLILALATWRITSLFYAEDGPYLVLARLRRTLGISYDEHSQRQAKNELAKLFNCPACLSVWVGSLVALAYWLTGITVWLCLPLALSTCAILIEGVVSDGES